MKYYEHILSSKAIVGDQDLAFAHLAQVQISNPKQSCSYLDKAGETSSSGHGRSFSPACLAPDRIIEIIAYLLNLGLGIDLGLGLPRFTK